jgi:hypothetical protein
VYPDDQELMIQTSLVVCGWQEGEALTATVQFPDGRVAEWTLPAEQDDTGFYFGRLDFQPWIDDPTGTYLYSLEGSSGRATAQVNYRQPDGPRLFSAGADRVFLYGFVPGESVALYCYDLAGSNDSQGNFFGKFLGSQDYVVDGSGQLWIQAPLDKCNFAAVGAVSGEVHLFQYDLIAGKAYDWAPDGVLKPDCGGLPTRLVSAGEARVAFTNGSKMRMRSQPGFSANIVASVPEGTQVLLGGHACADGTIWWNVTTAQGEGWMAEEQNGIYLLEPLP